MISKGQAINVARKRAEENKWGFCEPLEIIEGRSIFKRGLLYFIVKTNVNSYGGNARFKIDAITGNILEEGYLSR